ncbi:MAG: cell division protein FtsH, partial [Chitinophagia bacterium]|nr:cell division protein FtsH [Chitinophagia bacterium]
MVGVLKDDSQFYTYLPDYPNLVDKLQEKKVEVNAVPIVSKSERVIGNILGWLPFILMIALWIFFARGMAAGGKGALGFGKSRAKLLQENKNKVTFADVAGIDEAKQELMEIVDFLKAPKKYSD